MGFKVNYDVDDNIISIEINHREYFYFDEYTVHIPISAFIGQSIKDLPFNIPIEICDSVIDNTITLHNIPTVILQESDGIFKVQFDETATRKYWYAPVNLELWVNMKRNVVSKLYNAVIDNFDDDGAYIHFTYSIMIKATSFEELFEKIDTLYNDIEAATDIAASPPHEILEYKVTNYLRSLRKSLIGKNESSIEYEIYKKKLSEIIEQDLKENNPDKLIKEYKTFFSNKVFQKKVIIKGEKFYRGRIGNTVLKGAIDDCNWDFTLPYYGKNIGVPPALFSSSGRFNRAGTAYLYLATDLETCLAEVHLQVGQLCSIAEFECVDDIELIDLSDFGNDLELKIWYEVITQPIHDEIKYKYLITQFMSEVFMQFNNIGLYFKSVQSSGDNIVCFQPNKFNLIKYSEKLYKTESINYKYYQFEDSVREFSKRNDTHLINPYNSDIDDSNEHQINYMEEWIEYEKKSKGTQ